MSCAFVQPASLHRSAAGAAFDCGHGTLPDDQNNSVPIGVRGIREITGYKQQAVARETWPQIKITLLGLQGIALTAIVIGFALDIVEGKFDWFAFPAGSQMIASAF